MENNNTEFIMVSNYICHDNEALCLSWEPVGQSVQDGDSGLRVLLHTRDSLFNTHFIFKNKVAGPDGLPAADVGRCVCSHGSFAVSSDFQINK